MIRAILLFTALLFANASMAQSFVASLLGKDEKEAFKLYQQAEAGDMVANAKLYHLAKDGNEWASLQLGYLIETGKGFIAVGAEGKRLQLAPSANITDLRARSIEAGRHYATVARKNTLAAYNLGLLYLKGLATPAEVNDVQDEKEEQDLLVRDQQGNIRVDDPIHAGVRYMLLAAEKSKKSLVHPYMQLGAIYENGMKTIPRNDGLAADYYGSAAGMKEPQAQFKFGMIWLYGKGRQQDIGAARLWLTKAAEQWNRNAMLMLAKLDMEGSGLQGTSFGMAAQWLHVAGHGSPMFQEAAAPMLAKVPEPVSKAAANSARIWIASHARSERLNNYLVPLNRNPADQSNG